MRKMKEIKSVACKIGLYKNCPVLEFRVNGAKKKDKPTFFMGRWKLGVILRQLDDIRAFVSADTK